ncbi:hypothetical protein ON010_g608 [Phytophthora cinnamomi]|nr:hypothetical protein ON010_g608 [Phytophthora cinnamomi]
MKNVKPTSRTSRTTRTRSMPNGLSTDSSVTTHFSNTPKRFQTVATASKDAAVSAAVTCHSTTSTCSPNITTAATSSVVVPALTIANNINVIATASSKPTNYTPCSMMMVMGLERRTTRGPVAKGRSARRAWTALTRCCRS